MDPRSGSLITAQSEAQAAQPELALGMVEEAARAMAAEGIYTGDRLFRDDPVKYEAICRALAENWSKESIRKAFGVAWETVDAVAKREGASIREQKEEIRDEISGIIRCGLRSLRKKAEDGKLSVLDFGILIDKFQVLNGEASSIVGHKHTVTVDDMAEYLAGLEQAHVQEIGSQPLENAQRAALDLAPASPSPAQPQTLDLVVVRHP